MSAGVEGESAITDSYALTARNGGGAAFTPAVRRWVPQEA